MDKGEYLSRVFKLPKSQKLETCEEERAPKNKFTSLRRLVPLYSNLLFRRVSNIVEEICFGFLYKVYQHDQPRIYPKVIQISFVLEVEERQENGIRGRLKMYFKRNFMKIEYFRKPVTFHESHDPGLTRK